MTDKTKDVKQDKSSKESDEDTSKTKTDGQEEDVSKDVKNDDGSSQPKAIPYERFKEVNDKKKELEKELTSIQSQIEKPDDTQEKQEKPSDDDWRQKVDFAISHKDMEKGEIDYVCDWARFKGISPEKALKDDDVKSVLETKRKKVAQEKSVPEPTSQAATFNKKKLSDLKDKDIKENWNTVAQKAVQSGKKKSKA